MLHLPQPIVLILDAINKVQIARQQPCRARLGPLPGAIMLSEGRSSHRSLQFPIFDVDTNVSDRVGSIELRNQVVGAGVNGVEAAHDVPVKIKGGVLSHGGVEQGDVGRVEAIDAAVEGIGNGLADREGGESVWKCHDEDVSSGV